MRDAARQIGAIAGWIIQKFQLLRVKTPVSQIVDDLLMVLQIRNVELKEA